MEKLACSKVKFNPKKPFNGLNKSKLWCRTETPCVPEDIIGIMMSQLAEVLTAAESVKATLQRTQGNPPVFHSGSVEGMGESDRLADWYFRKIEWRKDVTKDGNENFNKVALREVEKALEDFKAHGPHSCVFWMENPGRDSRRTASDRVSCACDLDMFGQTTKLCEKEAGPNKYEYLDPLGMFYGEEDDYRLGYLRVHASGEESPPTEAPTSFPTTPAPTSPTAPPVFWQLVGE